MLASHYARKAAFSLKTAYPKEVMDLEPSIL
jgi:hypothetical protein